MVVALLLPWAVAQILALVTAGVLCAVRYRPRVVATTDDGIAVLATQRQGHRTGGRGGAEQARGEQQGVTGEEEPKSRPVSASRIRKMPTVPNVVSRDVGSSRPRIGIAVSGRVGQRMVIAKKSRWSGTR